MSDQQDSKFMYNFSLVIFALVVIAIGAYFMASHIYTGYVESQREDDMVASRLQPVGEVNSSGAAVTVASNVAAPEGSGASAEPEITDPNERAYRRICFSCHEMGIGGAPKTGDATAWAGRPEKGIATLMQSVINGVNAPTGVMLPRGGLPDMTDEEIRSAITYMMLQLPEGAAAAAGVDG
ncbi:MAG: cytochrome c5 family protein [Gammaproteobacteria bacterium]|nr:cytochrome c5 family protein [Gammaproteobacteria bacterium]